MAAFFAADQEVARDGVSVAWERAGESGATLTFHHCPTCGSTVFWTRSSRPGLICVAVGAFADPQFPPPQIAAWCEAKPDWLPLPQGLPTYDRSP